MFLKNREIRIKVAKTQENDEPTTKTVDDFVTPETLTLIEEHGKRLVKYVAIAVVATVATLKVLDTLGEIAVKKTKSADEE